MRIISGRLRGRRLKGPRGNDLRPTGDRLKETLFNIVGNAVTDAVFLDVFAGTGAIGIEALSRGAREVIFIESGTVGKNLIHANLKLTGLTDRYRIHDYDAFTALRYLARAGFQCDVAFLDPPYEWKPYRDLLELIFRAEIAHEGSSVIIEHHRNTALPDEGEDYLRRRIVTQSDKCLSVYQRRQKTGDRIQNKSGLQD